MTVKEALKSLNTWLKEDDIYFSSVKYHKTKDRLMIFGCIDDQQDVEDSIRSWLDSIGLEDVKVQLKKEQDPFNLHANLYYIGFIGKDILDKC